MQNLLLFSTHEQGAHSLLGNRACISVQTWLCNAVEPWQHDWTLHDYLFFTGNCLSKWAWGQGLLTFSILIAIFYLIFLSEDTWRLAKAVFKLGDRFNDQFWSNWFSLVFVLTFILACSLFSSNFPLTVSMEIILIFKFEKSTLEEKFGGKSLHIEVSAA